MRFLMMTLLLSLAMVLGACSKSEDAATAPAQWMPAMK
jgi:hypothetical protein